MSKRLSKHVEIKIFGNALEASDNSRKLAERHLSWLARSAVAKRAVEIAGVRYFYIGS